MSEAVDRLYLQILEAQTLPALHPRTGRLIGEGMGKMAKKVSEEAIEVALDAVRGDRDAVVLESADLIYNLCVLWAGLGVRPEEIWAEIERRERLYGIAEKLPKTAARGQPGS
jgi:phosphoribosyl-ATP pyrophosphohydrolase